MTFRSWLLIEVLIYFAPVKESCMNLLPLIQEKRDARSYPQGWKERNEKKIYSVKALQMGCSRHPKSINLSPERGKS